MTTVRKYLLALTIAVSTASCTHTDDMKLPNFWRYEQLRNEKCTLACATPYFHCDYSEQTCQRGYKQGSTSWMLFVFELLDGNNRSVILDRRACVTTSRQTECLSFNTGKGWTEGSIPELNTTFTVDTDLPAALTKADGTLLHYESWIEQHLGGQFIKTIAVFPTVGE